MDQIQSFFGQTPINNEEEKKKMNLNPDLKHLLYKKPDLKHLLYNKLQEETKEDDDE